MKTVRLLSWVLPISLVMGSAGMALAQDEEPPAEEGAVAPEGEAPPEGGEAVPEGDPAATEGDPAAAEAAATTGAADVEASATLTKANWPLALVDRPITLVKGLLQVRGDINVNLTKDFAGKLDTVLKTDDIVEIKTQKDKRYQTESALAIVSNLPAIPFIFAPTALSPICV